MRILYILFSHSIFIAAGVFAQQYHTITTYNLIFSAQTYWLFIFAALAAYNLYYWFSIHIKQPGLLLVGFFNGSSHLWTALVTGAMATVLYFRQSDFDPLFVMIGLFTLLYFGFVFSKYGRPDCHPVFRLLKVLLLAWVWWLAVFFYPIRQTEIPVDATLSWHACSRYCLLILICLIYDCKDDLLQRHDLWWKSIFALITGLLVISGMVASVNFDQYLLTWMMAGICACFFYMPRHPSGFWFYAFWTDGLLILPVLLQQVMSI